MNYGMKRIIGFALVGLFVLLTTTKFSAYSKEKYSTDQLQKLFLTEWRESTATLIENHLTHHKKCELEGTAETVRDMRILFPGTNTFPPRVRAIALSLNKIIMINTSGSWSKRYAVTVLIHEATHLTMKDGRWICGDDYGPTVKPFGPFPACRLFGKVQYLSHEITNDIEEHLSNELDELEDKK